MAPKGKPNRPREELVRLFNGHKKALIASCAGFDAGEDWEAERLATTVFTLVFDGPPIYSLLSQLDVLDSLKFVSSGRMQAPPGFPAPTVAMPSLLMTSSGRFLPKLGRGPPPLYRNVSFEDWWTNELIYQEKASGQLNRKRLVFALRHQDGGGHVGDLTDNIYVHLKGGAGWQVRHKDGSTEPVSNLVATSMRQIAWEVLETLKRLDGDLQ